MDWSAIGPLVAQAAPTIGGLLGGLIPFPGGAILGQLAGKVLAEALGVPPTPDAVSQAITTGDPAVIQAKLSEAESRMQAELEKHKADLADIQDARAATLNLVHAGSSMAWGAPVVSVLITLGFMGALALLMTTRVNYNDVTGQALLLLIGSLSTMQVSVVNYWLGSSAGSADKSAQIAALATITPPAAAAKKR